MSPPSGHSNENQVNSPSGNKESSQQILVATRIRSTVLVVTRTLSANPCGNKDQVHRLCGKKNYPSNSCSNKGPANSLCGSKDQTSNPGGQQDP
ncbi:hypothetical protein ACLKA6_005760 [Drosophila palustris]